MHQFKAAILLYLSSLERKRFVKLKKTIFYFVIKLMKPFAAPREFRIILRITLMLSRIFSEPLRSVSNKHNYKTFSESPHAFPPYFFNQLERQATIFDKQNHNLCMKRAPTHCPTPREIRQ